MSHQAMRYAKNVVVAPNGKRITPSEKLVLTQIADDHNMEIGSAWPSIANLANRCCLSPRHTRRIITSLVRKQILRRIAYKRDKDGSQSSNEYVLLALAHLPLARNQSETRRKVQKISRSPMSIQQGQQRPAATDFCGSRSRSTTSGSRGHQRPSLEHLKESLGRILTNRSVEQIPPTPLARATMVEDIQHRITDQREPWFRNLELVRKAWKDVLEAMEGALQIQKPSQLTGQPDFTANMCAWETFVSAKVLVESIDECKAGDLILKLKGRKLDVSVESFEPVREMITGRLEKYYGRKVEIVWPADKQIAKTAGSAPRAPES
jgi:Helix-turn-helix domain